MFAKKMIALAALSLTSAAAFAGDKDTADIVTMLQNPKVKALLNAENVNYLSAIEVRGTARCTGGPTTFGLILNTSTPSGYQTCTRFVIVGSCHDVDQKRDQVEISDAVRCGPEIVID